MYKTVVMHGQMTSYKIYVRQSWSTPFLASSFNRNDKSTFHVKLFF
jgi:hypothetical protein